MPVSELWELLNRPVKKARTGSGVCNATLIDRHALRGYDKVYAIGDLHGDIEALKACLRKSGVARESSGGSWRWVAQPRTAVVITGDIIDRMRPGSAVQTLGVGAHG